MIVDLEGLKTCAKALAEQVAIGDVIFLRGDLGAGKSTFSKFLIQALMGEEIPVTSPTFSLIHTYETPRGPLWHCDLYRLRDPNELEELGLEEAYYSAICLIEWPERMGSFVPAKHFDIVLQITSPDQRDLQTESVGRLDDRLEKAITRSMK